MKGAQAAQERGVSIYYEGHLRSDNLGLLLCWRLWIPVCYARAKVVHDDNGRATKLAINMVGETWINPLSDVTKRTDIYCYCWRIL